MKECALVRLWEALLSGCVFQPPRFHPGRWIDFMDRQIWREYSKNTA